MSLRTSIEFYILGTFILLAAKIKNTFSFVRFVFADNIEKRMYFIKGVYRAARFCNVEWHELDDLKPVGYEEIMQGKY